MKDMGELVRIRREAAGYRAQKHLADKIGKGQSWLSRLESGTMKEVPPPGDLALLEEEIGVTQAELLAAAGYDVTTGNEGDSPVIAALRPILESVDLDERELRTVVDLVRVYVGSKRERGTAGQ